MIRPQDVAPEYEAKSEARAELPTLPEIMDEAPPPGERLATGIPALDRCLRGGLVRGRVYTVIGPPGRGKTCLLCQLGLHLAKAHSARVIGLFTDEGPYQAALMMLEGLGFTRESLEDDYASIRGQVEAATMSLDIWLPDTTITDAVAGLRVDPDRLTVLILDSTQRVRLRRGEQPETARECAEEVMIEAHRFSRATNAIVLVASKANRQSYSKRKASDNTTGLSSGMDSSSIEYESDFLATLDGDIEESITLQVEKNRLGNGTKPAIHLRFDRQRATFTEIDAAEWAAAEEQREDDQRDKTLSAAMAKIDRWLRKHKDSSTEAVRVGAGVKANLTKPALEMLQSQGKATSRKGDHNAILWTARSTQDEDENP